MVERKTEMTLPCMLHTCQWFVSPEKFCSFILHSALFWSTFCWRVCLLHIADLLVVFTRTFLLPNWFGFTFKRSCFLLSLVLCLIFLWSLFTVFAMRFPKPFGLSLALPTRFSLGLFRGLTSPGEREWTSVPEKGRARIGSATPDYLDWGPLEKAPEFEVLQNKQFEFKKLVGRPRPWKLESLGNRLRRTLLVEKTLRW